MKVKDLSPRNIVTVVEGESLMNAAKALAEEEVGDVVVYGATGAIGVFSERDLTRAVADGVDLLDTTVEEYMTRSVVSVDWNASINDGVSKMNDLGIRHVVVLRDGEAQGMLSMRDIVGLLGTTWPEL